MKKLISYLLILFTFLNVLFSASIVHAHNIELDPEGYIYMPTILYGGSGKISVSSAVKTTYDLYYQSVDVSDSLYTQINTKYSEYEDYYEEEDAKLDEEEAALDLLLDTYNTIKDDTTATPEQIADAKTAYDEAVEKYNTHVNSVNAKLEEYKNTINGLKPTYVESNWTKTTDGEFTIDTSKYTGDYHFILWVKLVIGTQSYYDEGLYSTKGTKEITISLDKTEASIEVGETLKLNVTTNSTDTINWSSNNSDIVSVSNDGIVTAKAKGVATITASVEEKSATCTITVTEKEEIDQDNTDDEDVEEDNTDKGEIEDNVNDSNFSNAKFSFDYNTFNSLNVLIEDIIINEDNAYYMYVSKNKDENPVYNTKGATSIYKNDKGEIRAFFGEEATRNILEVKGKNYIYIIERDKQGNSKVVLNAKEMETLELPQLGKRLDIWLYDSEETSVSNTIGIDSKRKITYKIGKITSNEILKSFKNDSSNKAFNNLLKYAKDAKYLTTGTITVDGLDYNITKDLKLEQDAYYFVYMIVDTEEGKYNELEDVAIYTTGSLSDGNTLVHFSFNNIEIEEDEDLNLDEDGDIVDDTIIQDEELPYTGSSIIIALASIVITIAGYITYKKYKYLNIK